MCISTDFSAQYEHKAFATRTCEHPARSNMDVFIVTHSPCVENGERVVTTDVWRIFSEAKGSALFHNKALDDIVNYYRERLGLKLVYVFSDGCRSQYKGKRNFQKIATFPSRMHGVQLIHRFAASHHFKGPHDAYGKDAKHLCRTAERNQKARLASTHDVYYFCANHLPRPRREGVTAKEIVQLLPERPAEAPTVGAVGAEELRAVLDAAPTREAAEAIAARMVQAGMVAPPIGDEAAEAETEVVAGDTGEQPLMTVDEMDAEEAVAVAEARQAPMAETAQEASSTAEQEEAAAAERALEMDAEEEEEAGQFIFDEMGARVGAGHTAAEDSEGEPEVMTVEPATAAVEPATAGEPPSKRKRKARERQILCQAPGMEASGTAGEQRVEVEGSKRRGMFAAAGYFWLYYSVDPHRKRIPVEEASGELAQAGHKLVLAQAGECHGYLDLTVETDADSIEGSNSTYEFAGVCADQPELLYTRTYSCVCASCRGDGTINREYSGCPFMGTVGKWRQQTIHSAANVTKQVQVQRQDSRIFASRMEPDKLYAAYASYREELGGRDYWLLRTKAAPRPAGKPIKVPGGSTIAAKTWVVEAQWYLSSSDDQRVKSYELQPETVFVPVCSLIQDTKLEFRKEGRTGGKSFLHPDSHARLMSINYSNVV